MAGDHANQSPHVLAGGCHCGAVRFSVRLHAPPDQTTLLDCNCSICTKKGFLHLIVGGEDLDVEAAPEALATYRFGTRTAQHHFCRTCGIAPFYRPRSHPKGWSVNARCLDAGFAEFEVAAFDGENWEAARARLGHG